MSDLLYGARHGHGVNMVPAPTLCGQLGDDARDGHQLSTAVFFHTPRAFDAAVNFNSFDYRLDRGIQSATEMLPLKTKRRCCTVLTAPPRLSDMHLADALV